MYQINFYSSTIGLEESQQPLQSFRPIKPKRTFSVDSIHSDSPYVKKATSKVSSRVLRGSSQKKVTPPQTSNSKNHQKSSTRSHDSSLESSFANIAGIKSATNSVQSTRSNFEVNAK